MSVEQYDTIRAIEWDDTSLKLLDQRLLPRLTQWLEFNDALGVAHAITDMVVRGAPAIGISAAYGVVLAARQRYNESSTGWKEAIEKDITCLAESRPTAVNLFWALDRMKALINEIDGNPFEVLLTEANKIHEEDVLANRRMGELGAALIEEPCAVLTHCNAGSLATGGFGTALGVIRAAFAQQKVTHVFADETRPWLQGARLTAWELYKDGLPVTLLGDGAAANLMKQGKVKWAIVGSDRIAANGDVANKIGTYSVAVAAKYHGIKLMVVAPTSTVDMAVATGAEIPIEERDESELLSMAGKPIAPEGVRAWNPSFDVTPAELVDAIVTERGVVQAPNREKMAAMMAGTQS